MLRSQEERWVQVIDRLGDGAAAESFWCIYSPVPTSLPKQGWKIHLAATPRNAVALLHIAARVTRRFGLVLKFPRHIEGLVRLNAGIGQAYAQSGKIFTFYGASEATLLDAAKALVLVTNRFRCPPIPFDERVEGGRNVYFRYGIVAGDARQLVLAPDGSSYMDRREKGAAIPSWAKSSAFAIAAMARSKSRHHASELLPADLLPFAALSQRAKGGVYKALDLSVAPGRVVVIKEGRLDGEISISGLDGFMLARREATNLLIARKAGAPVPKVLRTINFGSHYFVVTDFLDGLALAEFAHQTPNFTERLALCKSLLMALARLNRRNLLWRDCKPPNVVVLDRRPHFLDMEGACKQSMADRSRWGSPGYVPDFRTVPHWYQDRFAGLITAIQVLTLDFSPPDRNLLSRRVRESELPLCSEHLSAFLASPSIATIDDAISAITRQPARPPPP